MKIKSLMIGAFAVLAVPAIANAQASDTAIGAGTGAATGAIIGGPAGAAVGAGVGAIAGAISDSQRGQFREHVVRERRNSYRYEGDVRVGVVLPESGVTYYEVPAEYGVRGYRYTVVNDRPVLVEPGSRRVVQIID